MGLFKKPVDQVENDDDIRREIRARVAKQAGIYDEEYVRTGKIGGDKKDNEGSGVTAASHVSAAAVSIPDRTATPEAEKPIESKPEEPKAVEPRIEESKGEEPKIAAPNVADAKPQTPVQATVAVAASKPPKEKTPPKEKKPPREKTPRRNKLSSNQKPRKKTNIALVLFVVVLLLAFIPLYYFLTGTNGNDQVMKMNISATDSTLLLSEPLLVRGMVSDTGDAEGIKVYYSIDSSSAQLLYTFSATPGPFEYEIVLPDTADFVGNHEMSFYAEDPSGVMSEAVVISFEVTKPALTGLKITSPPDKVKYVAGDKLNLKGLVVSALYEDGKSVPIKDYNISKPNGTILNKTGKSTIKISYVENSVKQVATFSYTVAAAPVTPPPTPSDSVNSSFPSPSLELFNAGGGSVDLQWSVVGSASGYQIQRKPAGGSWSTVNTVSSSFTSWTNRGLSTGKSYSYRIRIYKNVDGARVFGPYSSAKSISL